MGQISGRPGSDISIHSQPGAVLYACIWLKMTSFLLEELKMRGDWIPQCTPNATLFLDFISDNVARVFSHGKVRKQRSPQKTLPDIPLRPLYKADGQHREKWKQRVIFRVQRKWVGGEITSINAIRVMVPYCSLS